MPSSSRSLAPPASLAGLALALALALPSAGAAQTFQKITDPAHPVVAAGPPPIEYTGASWIDADGDGDDDLFVSSLGLFRNDGGGAFARLPAAVPPVSHSLGNTWADVENDGDLDLFQSGGFASGSSLYLNQGGLAFSRVTTGPIGNSLANAAWGCAFGDFDADGHIDLVTAAGNGFIGNLPNRLFHNDGNGVFSLVDTASVYPEPAAYTVPSWSDFDLDGDPDLFIAAGPVDGTVKPDYLFRNRNESSPGWFPRYQEAPLGQDAQDGQLYNWIDYDNDGDLDCYLTNFFGGLNGYVNRLYRNDGGAFVRLSSPVTTGQIVIDQDLSLASVWQDYDNDGDLDCFVTNAVSDPNRYYRNNGNGSFSSVALGALTAAGHHYGAASADYDGDGLVDLYVAGDATGFGLYRNTTANANGWLDVRLVGTMSNRAAIGARIRVLARIGVTPRWQLREISAQNSFGGMNSLVAHFGLGTAALADSVIVEWPSGLVSTRVAVAARTRLEIVEEGATAVAASLASAAASPGRVEIVWRLDGSPASEVRVQRATRAGAWTTLAVAVPDGAGLVRHVDRSVEAGRRYGYRLAMESGEEVGETWLEVPAAEPFGIVSIAPNPARGPIGVTLALDGRGPASLELIDVAGRRIGIESIEAPTLGRRLVTLRGPERLRAGVYFVRLRQGALADVRRVLLAP